MKHAYLIISHDNLEVLRLLLEALDDVRNDVYVHFDKKMVARPSLAMKHAGLYMIDEPVSVYWGDRSVVEAEYALFAKASSTQAYAYYHLLSGVDFPLKGQDDIHAFFERNKGREFIGFYQGDAEQEIDRKVRRIHVFSKHFRQRNVFLRGYRAAVLRGQFVVGYRRNRSVEFKKGTQWGSFTDPFVRYVLSQKEEVLKMYSNTFCSDEIYKQTICWNSDFRTKVFDADNEANGAMRCVSWKDGEMLSWSMDDYAMLMDSGFLFARKFSEEHIDLVKEIAKTIM